MPGTIRVLVIDGEEIILKSISRALISEGNVDYTVITANTALEGLKLVRNEIFHVIFVDFALPGMNSLELLRRIKNTSPSASVILMSGFSSKTAFPNEVSDTADGFLSKPFTTGEITSLVSSILQRMEQRAKRERNQF